MQEKSAMWIADALLEIEAGCRRQGLSDVADVVGRAMRESIESLAREQVEIEKLPETTKIKLVYSSDT